MVPLKKNIIDDDISRECVTKVDKFFDSFQTLTIDGDAWFNVGLFNSDHQAEVGAGLSEFVNILLHVIFWDGIRAQSSANRKLLMVFVWPWLSFLVF